MSRRLALVLLLAFVGGYADAASFLLTRAFTGHVTGNTVLLGLHLVQGSWRQAFSSAVAVMAFLVGTGSAEWMKVDTGPRPEIARLRLPLVIEFALLAVAAVIRWWSGSVANDLSVVFLCLGLGVQNGALRKCGTLSVHTTFITGMGTALTNAAVHRLSDGRDPKHSPANTFHVLPKVLAAFFVGVAAGGWLCGHYKVWGLTGIFVPLLSAVLLTIHPGHESRTGERPDPSLR